MPRLLRIHFAGRLHIPTASAWKPVHHERDNLIRQMDVGSIPDNACCFATGGSTLSSLRRSKDLYGSVLDGVICFSRNGITDPYAHL